MPASKHNPIQLAYSIPVSLGSSGDAEVEIRVSSRRKRYAQAHLEPGKVVVVVPVNSTVEHREKVARQLAQRMLDQSSRRVDSDADLERRAHDLADMYLDSVRPASIHWVTNQARRWGSCTPATGAIRLSNRLQTMPSFVLDSVIVHELAHLLEASHCHEFRLLEARYPRRAEADAYLRGYEHGVGAAGTTLGAIPRDPWGSDDVD